MMASSTIPTQQHGAYFDTWLDPKPTTTLIFKTDPIDIALDVYSPAGNASNGPAPLLVWYHLGGLLYGDRKSILPRWLFNACNDRGYTVISADYRLAPEANIHDILSDLTDCWTFIHTKLNAELNTRDLPPVKLDSIAVGGISAGGYMALQAGHLLHPTPSAILSISAQSDVDPSWWAAPHPGSTLIAGTPIQKAFDMEAEILPFFAPGAPQVSGVPYRADENPREMLYHYVIGKGIQLKTIFGVDAVSDDPDLAHLWPQTAIKPGYPPTYLLAGSADASVPHEESVHIQTVLERHGAEHVFRLLEGKDHLLDQEEGDEGVGEVRREIMAFLERKW